MEEVVLCGASAYSRKFYLNEEFSGLPERIKEELNILCVLFTEDVGGALQLFFIGFIGEYILSINQRVMNRPLVIEEERINFEEDDGTK